MSLTEVGSVVVGAGAAGLGAATVTSLLFWLHYLLKRGRAAKMFEKLRQSVSQFGWQADDLEALRAELRAFDEEYERQKRKVDEARGDVRSIGQRIDDLKEEERSLAEKRRNAESSVRELKMSSGVSSVEEYHDRLAEKKEKERIVERELDRLENLLPSKAETPEDRTRYWTKALEDLREYEEKAPGIRYDERSEAELRGRKEELANKRESLQEELKSFQRRLGEIERDAGAVLRGDEVIRCATSVDLRGIRRRLLDFREETLRSRDNVLKAIDLLREIERSEKEKIAGHFGGGSPVSLYFKEITGGKYEEVTYDPEEERIRVGGGDGPPLEASRLSGGAFDQLYLSIRLALGEKLLGEDRGFFIMDDPFIKADKGRLARQMEILRGLSERGWQIIYFSAKEEVRRLLDADIKEGRVTLSEI